MLSLNSYQPGSPEKKVPHRRRVIRRVLVSSALVVGAAALTVAAFIAVPQWTPQPSGVASTQSDTLNTPPPSVEPPQPAPSIVLTPNKTIQDIIDDNPKYKVGVALQDVTTGEHKAYGVKKPFVAASTAKLITAAAYYHLVETGKASLNTQLGRFTAQKHIQLMINQSNNDSWETLLLKVGYRNVTHYAASIDISYAASGNTIVPASMASFLSDLYNGRVLNRAHTKELLSYMQDTNYETLIPAVVPDDITVYHKYGLLTYVVHDVAILVKGDTAYTLAVYTEGADYNSMEDRVNIIHKVTQAAVKQLFDAPSNT